MKPMKEADWVKRQFSFDLPVELFPALIERVRGTPARLEEMVRSYSPHIITKHDFVQFYIWSYVHAATLSYPRLHA